MRFAQAGGAPRDDPLGDAAFALLMTPRHWERLDTRALRADGIEASSVAISTGIERSLLRFRNDSHWNARGHRLFAQGLTPFVKEQLRAVLQRRAAATR